MQQTIQRLLCQAGTAGCLAFSSLASGQLVINEIDANTPSTDTVEFIELYDGGTGNTSLDGYILVLFNGSDGLSYDAIDLSGQSTNAEGYFVAGGVANADLALGSNFLQNGSDAVALYQDQISTFPNDTAPTTTNLVDAFVYQAGSTSGDPNALVTALNPGSIVLNENGNGNDDNESLARVPEGGAAFDSNLFAAQTPTPGSTNNIAPTLSIDLTDSISGDGLYSIPEEAGGFSVAGIVRRSGGDLSAPLTVTLTSSNTSRLEVDSFSTTVEFLANSTEAFFDLSTIPNSIQDGNELVTITASAVGSDDATADILVLDDETPLSSILINEIRTKQGGPDLSQYVELYGASANASLDGLSLVFISEDTGGGSGGVEKVITFGPGDTLNGNYHLTASSTLEFGTADLTSDFSAISTNENLTVLLVDGFTGAVSDDLDTDDDGVLDATPWTSILDAVALIDETNANTPAGSPLEYAQALSFPTVGPEGFSSPGHIYRGTDGTYPWVIGDFGLGDEDTPGTENGVLVQRLTLTLDPTTVAEADATGASTGTITRNGSTTSELIVNLTSSDTSAATVPATVTIPSNQIQVEFSVDAVDNATMDGTLTTTIEATSPGFLADSADLTVTDDDTPVFTNLVINEVDAANPGTDSLEYVELYNLTASDQPLDGLSLVFFNGDLAGNPVYQTVDLTGQTIPANGYFVVGASGVANVDYTPAGWTSNEIQNGPDAVALYQAVAGEIANDTLVADITNTLVDALVYGNDLELSTALNLTGTAPGDNDTDSLQRNPDGGTALDNSTYTLFAPTPGATNQPTPELTLILDPASIAEDAGLAASLGTVTRSGDTTADLMVTIAATDPDGRINAPTSVTIPAGLDSATFDIAAVDNTLQDGPATITIVVAATGYTGASTDLSVADDDFVPPSLVINEVMYDPNDGTTIFDSNNDGTPDSTDDEYVEIVNTGSTDLDLSGLTISDSPDNTSVRFTFPDGTTLLAGQAAVVFGGGTPTGFPASILTFTAGSLGLNNSGDTVTLADSSGNVIDSYTWTSNEADGTSATRDPDLTGTFVPHNGVGNMAAGTPGRQSDGTEFSDSGTQPANVEIISCSYDSTTGNFTLDWDSGGQAVNIWRSTDLVDWGTNPIASGVTATTFTDENAPSGRAFYRVELP